MASTVCRFFSERRKSWSCQGSVTMVSMNPVTV